MQVSPFYANYGFKPHAWEWNPRRTSKVEAAEDFAKRMQRIHEEAQAALSKARDENETLCRSTSERGTRVQSRAKGLG